MSNYLVNQLDNDKSVLSPRFVLGQKVWASSHDLETLEQEEVNARHKRHCASTSSADYLAARYINSESRAVANNLLDIRAAEQQLVQQYAGMQSQDSS
jgi:hypothetical protein